MTEYNLTPQVVTIAGSDSGGGAGMQADLKTFQARQAFGLNIVIALTAQNTYGVQDSLPIPSSFIDAQFQSLAADFKIGAAKTGMLADSERVEAVVRNLQKVDFGPLIVDPVMVAKGGHHLLEAEAVQTIKEQLLPLATVVTPNLPEAEVLLETTIKTEQEMQTAAKKLQQLGTKNIIMKGGHSTNGRRFELLAKCTTNCNEKYSWNRRYFFSVYRSRISKRYAVRSGDCDWQTVYTRGH